MQLQERSHVCPQHSMKTPQLTVLAILNEELTVSIPVASRMLLVPLQQTSAAASCPKSWYAVGLHQALKCWSGGRTWP